MRKVSTKEVLDSIASQTRLISPLGLNAKRVVAKRYSLKDATGASLE